MRISNFDGEGLLYCSGPQAASFISVGRKHRLSLGAIRVASFSKLNGSFIAFFGSTRKPFIAAVIKDKPVDHRSCGYVVKSDPKRAARTEIEHVVPALHSVTL